MIQLKKSLRLFGKPVAKKINRKKRNRAQKLFALIIPASLIISVVCIILIFILVTGNHKPILISPLLKTLSGIDRDENIYQSELEKSLSGKKINYSSVVFNENNYYIITLPDSSVVIISSQKDLRRQISSLQYILFRLTMEGKQFSRLDLRFDKPVIVLK